MTCDTGLYSCDDGGTYYIQVRDSRYYWFGEHPDGRFANVFVGQRSGDIIRGDFFDVPKGRNCKHGSLTLREDMYPLDAGMDIPECYLRKIDSDPYFGGGFWHHGPAGDSSSWLATTNPVLAGFQEYGFENISGTWLGDDGGSYYLHQVGDRIVWFGEHPSANPPGVWEVDSAGTPTTWIKPAGWSNVFTGHRSGALIDGQWTTVPKGESDRHGSLSLRLTSEWKIEVTNQTGGFGGRTFWRVESLAANINLSTLKVHKTDDPFGDEPVIHMVLVKLDGRSIHHENPGAGTAQVVPRNSGGLGNNVKPGTALALPDTFGRFTEEVMTIAGADPRGAGSIDSVLALAIGAWDQEWSSSAERRHNFEDWHTMLKRNLDQRIHSGEPIDFAELSGRRHLTYGWFTDDYLGHAAIIWRFSELAALIGQPATPFRLEVRGADAHYELQGTVSIHTRLNPDC
jgi:hypothetical protein